MAGKSIRFFRGQCVNGRVMLFIERGSGLYHRSESILNFRIYRKKEDAFVQGTDYGEYFDAVDVKDAELIYAGPLEKREQYYFVFTDTGVKPRDVYT